MSKKSFGKKQVENYNRMRDALVRIAKYQSTIQIKKYSERDWGVDYEEALEMAYENIQQEAFRAVKGVRNIPVKEEE